MSLSAYPWCHSTTLSPVRRGLAFGLLALGVLIIPSPSASAQPTSAPPPTVPATPATPAAGSPEPTATTRVLPTQSAGRGITAGGEGFPWIPVGVGILVAGLIGSRQRRASRR